MSRIKPKSGTTTAGRLHDEGTSARDTPPIAAPQPVAARTSRPDNDEGRNPQKRVPPFDTA
uniref:Uncharacterized protein n=1 Tax=Janibacter limosus TaxID=53458 RepID=A0AC61U0U8_9MICO|nr:hypothetical protein [Janibacter limosus]